MCCRHKDCLKQRTAGWHYVRANRRSMIFTCAPPIVIPTLTNLITGFKICLKHEVLIRFFSIEAPVRILFLLVLKLSGINDDALLWPTKTSKTYNNFSNVNRMWSFLIPVTTERGSCKWDSYNTMVYFFFLFLHFLQQLFTMCNIFLEWKQDEPFFLTRKHYLWVDIRLDLQTKPQYHR